MNDPEHIYNSIQTALDNELNVTYLPAGEHIDTVHRDEDSYYFEYVLRGYRRVHKIKADSLHLFRVEKILYKTLEEYMESRFKKMINTHERLST